MKVKVFGLSLALALLGATAARAQAPMAPAAAPPVKGEPPKAKADEKLPAAEEVFNKYLQALGGETALGKF